MNIYLSSQKNPVESISNSLPAAHQYPQDMSVDVLPHAYACVYASGLPGLMTPCCPPGRAAAPVSTVMPAAMEPLPVHWTCYLSQTCCFQLSRDSRSGRDTLIDWLWKANWHLLLRCWSVAPSITTVIIIIWPCWSSMNILAMFCYNLHPAQPKEDWPPLIAWFLSRFLPRFWHFQRVFPSHCASTPALLAV